MLQFIIDQCKTQDMHEKAVNDYPFMLKFVSYWSVTPKTLQVLDNVEDLDDLIVWYNKYKNRKVYKKELYKELMPIA